MSLIKVGMKVGGFFTAMLVAVASYAQAPVVKPQFLQQPNEAGTYASAADVAALVAQAQKERKNDAPLVVGKIVQNAPYTVYLEYRASGKALGDVGIHEKADELVYMLQGAGTLVTGGKASADRMHIDGGVSQKVAKGDFVFIPAGTPHWISQIDQTIVLMTVHLPASLPGK